MSRVGPGIGVLGGVDVPQAEGVVLGFQVVIWIQKLQTTDYTGDYA